MTTYDVTEEQIKALMQSAGQAGDRTQVAVCLVALHLGSLTTSLDDLDGWQRECIEEERGRLERLGIIPEHANANVVARAECARVIADAAAQRCDTMSADALVALSEESARTVTEYPGTVTEESALLRDLRDIDSYEREEDVSGAGYSGSEARGYTDVMGATWRIHVVHAGL